MALIHFNIDISYWKFLFLVIIIASLLSFFLFILASYYIYKWLEINIDDHFIFFNDYYKQSKSFIDMYGKYPIKKILLIKQPCHKGLIAFINLITLYNFEKEVNKYRKKTNDKKFYPHHTFMAVEIQIDKKIKKWILIEKTYNVSVTTNFHLRESQTIRVLKPKTQLSLRTLLDKTRKRVGDNEFFNWHICKNNCQMLMKELLITMNLYTKKNKKFMCQEEFVNKINFTDFTLYLIHCITNLYNLIETQLQYFFNFVFF